MSTLRSALLLVLACFAAGGALAQDEGKAAPAVVTAPDPGSLSADWWNFLSQAGNDAAARGLLMQQRLDTVVEALTQVGEPHDTIRALATELDGLIPQYVDALDRKPAEAPGAEPSLESYSIRQYLDLVARQREQAFELTLESEEMEREKEALAGSDQAIKNMLAAYLELSPAAPERMPSGLRLMRARLLWGIGSEDVRVRKARQEQLQASVAHITGLVAEAATRLLASEAGVAEWQAARSTANQELKQLAEEASIARLRGALFPDNDRGIARQRQHAQELRNFEVRMLRARVRMNQAELAVALGEHLIAPSDARAEALRTARRSLDELVTSLPAQLRTFRQATDRERAAAEGLLTEASEKVPGLGELHQGRIRQADETIQNLNRVNREVAESTALLVVVSQKLVESEGKLADLAVRAGEFLDAAFARMSTWASISLFTLNDTPVTTLGLIRFTIILVIAWWLSRLVRGGLAGMMRRRDTMNQASLYTLSRLFHYGILVVGFFVAMSSIGIDFTKFALIASAFGVGLGFGLQAIFSNFVAGLIILFERSLKVGDFVELESGVTGEVREINIRSTLVTTNDNIDMLLPNAEFVNGRVINWTLREAFRRSRVPFGVAYGTDKDLVRKAALEAAAEVPFTLTGVTGREPQVWLVGFGDSSLDFELVVWLVSDAVKRPSAVHAAYCWAIESALGRHGIEIPFPQRDLHLRSGFERVAEA